MVENYNMPRAVLLLHLPNRIIKMAIVSKVRFFGGDESARATYNEIRPQRTTAVSARCVVGGGGWMGGVSASTLSK